MKELPISCDAQFSQSEFISFEDENTASPADFIVQENDEVPIKAYGGSCRAIIGFSQSALPFLIFQAINHLFWQARLHRND